MVALEETETRELIGHMIMWILDLYLEGIVPLPKNNFITARINYLALRWHHERT